MPFSAGKFADFPPNHGLEFSPLLASSNKPFQTFYPPFTSTGRHIRLSHGPRCPDRQEEDLQDEHLQGLAGRLRYRTDPVGTSDLPDVRPDLRQSVQVG